MNSRVFILLSLVLVSLTRLAGQTSASLPATVPEQFDWDHEIAVGDDAYNDSNYVEAEQHYRKSLEVAERLHLSEAQRATSTASVAQCLRYQKKFVEAEPLFREALAIREKVLPPNHPRTALTLEGLGACLYAQNRMDEAEGYFLRALAIRDRLTGDDDYSCPHGDVLERLGRLYFRQGKQEKAQAMYERALSIWVAAKEKCTLIVQVMNDLAALYVSQGKLETAEQMYRTTIPMLEKELGDEEPELVANQRVQLGKTYIAENKFAEAEPELRRAVPALQKRGPSGHERLLAVLNLYRMVLERLNRPDDVRRVQAQIDAINGWRAESVDPLVRWQGLMALVNQSRSKDQQLALLKQALNEVEKIPPGQNLIDTLSRLGVLSVRDQMGQAEQYDKRALSVAESVFGKDSREAADCLQQLASLYEMQQKPAEAEPLRKRQIAILEKVSGQELQLALGISHLGDLYDRQKRYAEAEPYYLRALKIDETRSGKNESNMSFDAERLAVLYSDWGKNEQAVIYFRQVVDLEERQYGANSPRLLYRLQSLADLMRKLNRPAEAQQYESRHKEIIDQQIANNAKPSTSK